MVFVLNLLTGDIPMGLFVAVGLLNLVWLYRRWTN